LSPEEIADKNRQLDEFADELKNENDGKMLKASISIDQRSMILDYSYNQKYDLHRKYPVRDDDQTAEENFRRTGSDDGKPENQKEAVGYTDQVMYGLTKSYERSNIDPKNVPIENIVRRNIETVDTNRVIEASLARSGQKLEGADDVVAFDKGTPEFEAIMGTIHGERMLQLLTEYVLPPHF
jgi:hypothetical protein